MWRRIFVVLIGLIFYCTLPLLAQDAAKIIYLKGRVELQVKDTNVWQKAKIRDLIKIGDMLKTGKNSSAELAFDKELGNIVKLDEYSSLIIKSFNPVQVGIAKGRVFSIIDNLEKGSTFEVRTPQAVAGARGTGWSMNIKGNATLVEGYDRIIYVSGLDKNGSLIGKLDVPSGFKSKVKEFNEPMGLVKLTMRDINRWNKLKSKVERHKKNFLNPQPEVSDDDNDDEEYLEDKFKTQEEALQARFESMHERVENRVGQRESDFGNDSARDNNNREEDIP